MNTNLQTIASKSLKVAGALTVATGVVAVGAVVASGAALGAMVEGFKAAGDAVKSILTEEEKKKQEAVIEPEATDVVNAEVTDEVQQTEAVQNEMLQEEVVTSEET